MHRFGTKDALFGYFWTGIQKQFYHISNQHLQIYLIPKFHKIMKMPKFGPKNVLFGFFSAGIWRQYCHVWDQQPQICLIAKFRENQKFRNLGQKMPWTKCLDGIFDQKCLTWVFLDWNLKKNIVIFEISVFEFVLL